jgi:hypothetical protein
MMLNCSLDTLGQITKEILKLHEFWTNYWNARGTGYNM